MMPDALDAKLRDLLEASERVKASLLELEVDPNCELLAKTTLAGATAAAWSPASAALRQLWSDHAALNDLLERAQEVRGKRRQPHPDRLAELQGLLCGASIELSDKIPLDRRQLLTVPRYSPDQLLARMSTAYREVTAVIAAAGRAWDSLGPRLAALQTGLAEAAQLARGLGDAAARECDAQAARCGELARSLATDPLSVRPVEVETLEGALAELRQGLAALDELRGHVDERLREAASLVERVRAAQREAEEARAEALAKIADPKLTQPDAPAADLERELAQIRAHAGAGAWREANDGLARWTAQASAALANAQRAIAESRAPIEERNELRGRLDAYQGRARRLRLTEDPALAELFGRAHESLYHAPTDLARARELVRRYQEALAGHGSAEEVSR
jgi:hypothetical protein